MPVLAEIAEQLINGRGFQRISGLPVDRLGADDASWIYWGVGMHLGVPWAQNAKGHLLGDVKDQGKALDDPPLAATRSAGVRSGSIPTARILSGCCVSTGRVGGESLISNALLCHNLLAASDPELAGALYEVCPTTSGEQAADGKPYYRVPAFSRQVGVCSFATSRNSSWRRSATSLRPGSPPRRRRR